jgi:hypothetical protein
MRNATKAASARRRAGPAGGGGTSGNPAVRDSDRRAAEAAALRQSLEAHYSNEGNFAVVKPSDDRGTIFPDGHYWAMCTTWAAYVRRLEGPRAKLYGIDSDDIPESEIVDFYGGHDFAVVDDRFIVDGFAVNVFGCSRQAVFDLQDPADAPDIRRLFGDPSRWLDKCRNVGLERYIDKESIEVRERAMKGVIRRTGTKP